MRILDKTTDYYITTIYIVYPKISLGKKNQFNKSTTWELYLPNKITLTSSSNSVTIEFVVFGIGIKWYIKEL